MIFVHGDSCHFFYDYVFKLELGRFLGLTTWNTLISWFTFPDDFNDWINILYSIRSGRECLFMILLPVTVLWGGDKVNITDLVEKKKCRVITLILLFFITWFYLYSSITLCISSHVNFTFKFYWGHSGFCNKDILFTKDNTVLFSLGIRLLYTYFILFLIYSFF